jgi:phosphonatase-like hydrolase
MIKLVVFDIAGTTVEEHGAVYRALADAVAAAGVTPSLADIERWMGAGKREAIEALLTQPGSQAPGRELVDSTFADFRVRLDTAYRDSPPTPIPGVPETLTRLREAGIRIALTTGFDREVTTALLGSLGWGGELLDAVICVDDVAAGRPAPYLIFRAMEATGVTEVASVLTAGDTVRDVQAGRNAGAALVVAVLTGGVSHDTLARQSPSHILPSVNQIPGLLDDLGQLPTREVLSADSAP